MQDLSPGLPDPALRPDFYETVPLKRLLAFGADMVLIVLIALVFVPFTAFVALFFFPALVAGVNFVYRWVTIARASATPGMRLMAIELRDGRGQRLDAGTAFLHTLIFTASFAFLLPALVSIGLMLTGPRKQGLHDLALGTAAINRPG